MPATARDALRRLVADTPDEPLLSQLVHGDFRSANVLRVGSKVAAVIDFEEARLDDRIVELRGRRFCSADVSGIGQPRSAG